MITVGPLSVPGTVGAISVGLDLISLDKSSSLAVQLDGADLDAVAIYGSNLPAMSSVAQGTLLKSIPSGGPVNPLSGAANTGGQTPAQIPPPEYRYLYAVRTRVATPGILNLYVTGQETAGTAGGGGGVATVGGTAPIHSSGGPNPVISFLGTAIVDGGNTTGATIHIGTNDAEILQLGADTAAAPVAYVRFDPGGGTPVALLDTAPGGVIEIGFGAGAKTVSVGNASTGSLTAIGAGDGGITALSPTGFISMTGGSQSSKLADTHVDTTDSTLTTLASFLLPTGKTLRGRFIVQANLLGDGTNPNPAPSTFYRECMATIPWPALAFNGAVSSSDAGLTFVTAPFVAGTAPFHTPINYSVMLVNDGTHLLVKVQGGGSGANPTWQLHHTYTAGTIVVTSLGSYYYCLANIASATTEPTGTSANIADDTGAWSYLSAGAITIRWTLCSYELFKG